MTYRGIFWITDMDDPASGIMVAKIPAGSDAYEAEAAVEIPLNSKKHDNYNHALTWNEICGGSRKAFDYYPRGRVEIHGTKVTIYANPHICTDEVMGVIVNEFGLNSDRISSVRMIPDYSEHYKCYLDRNQDGKRK